MAVCFSAHLPGGARSRTDWRLHGRRPSWCCETSRSPPHDWGRTGRWLLGYRETPRAVTGRGEGGGKCQMTCVGERGEGGGAMQVSVRPWRRGHGKAGPASTARVIVGTQKWTKCTVSNEASQHSSTQALESAGPRGVYEGRKRKTPPPPRMSRGGVGGGWGKGSCKAQSQASPLKPTPHTQPDSEIRRHLKMRTNSLW